MGYINLDEARVIFMLQILTVTADVTKEEDVRNIVKTTVDRFGSIHVLVGIARYEDTLCKINAFFFH